MIKIGKFNDFVARAPNIERTLTRARLVCSVIEGRRAATMTNYEITGKHVSAIICL